MSIESSALHFTTDGERALAAYAAALQAEVQVLRVALGRLCEQVAPGGEAAHLVEQATFDPAVRRAPLRIHLDHMARTGSTLAEAVQVTCEVGPEEAAAIAGQWVDAVLGVDAEPYGDQW